MDVWGGVGGVGPRRSLGSITLESDGWSGVVVWVEAAVSIENEGYEVGTMMAGLGRIVVALCLVTGLEVGLT